MSSWYRTSGLGSLTWGSELPLLRGTSAINHSLMHVLPTWSGGWDLITSRVHFSYGLLVCVCSKPLQSYLTLCDLIVCCPPGSSVRGILQAKCVAMLSSRASSQAWDGTQVSCDSCIPGGFFTAEPWGSPHSLIAVPSLYWRRSFLIGSHLFRQWLFCRQLWFGCSCGRR